MHISLSLFYFTNTIYQKFNLKDPLFMNTLYRNQYSILQINFSRKINSLLKQQFLTRG